MSAAKLPAKMRCSKKTVVKWTLDRPYSVATACGLGCLGMLLGLLWVPLALVGVVLWLGLIVLAGHCIEPDRYSPVEKAKRSAPKRTAPR